MRKPWQLARQASVMFFEVKNPTQKIHDQSITLLVRPLILALRWLGSCQLFLTPMTTMSTTTTTTTRLDEDSVATPNHVQFLLPSSSSSPQNFVVYKFRTKSLVTMKTVIVGGFFFVTLPIFMHNSIQGQRQERVMAMTLGNSTDEKIKRQFALYFLTDKGENFAVTLLRFSVNVVMPISHMTQILISWVQSRSLANFLNSLNPLEQILVTEIITTKEEKFYLERISKFRNYLLPLYVCLPTMTLVLALIGSTILANEGGPLYLKFFENFIAILELGPPLLEDALVLLSYKILAELLRETGLAIDGLVWKLTQNDLFGTMEEPLHFSRRLMDLSNLMKMLRKTILQIKDASELAGEWQSPRELLNILTSISLLTIMAHVVIHGPHGPAIGYFWKFGATAFGLTLLARMYFKGVIVDEINVQDQFVAQRLLNLMEEITDDDRLKESELFIEAKFIHDIMMSNPTRISLGNYVSMNKKLILGICSQVVTYFIVLTQFTQQL